MAVHTPKSVTGCDDESGWGRKKAGVVLHAFRRFKVVMGCITHK